MARAQGRGRCARPAGGRGDIPRRGAGRAGGCGAAARQRLQGAARRQCHDPDAARPGGGTVTTIAERRAVGASLDRRDGPQKVTGVAPYAYEHHFDHPLYLFPVQSDVARGKVTRIDAADAEALPGVVAVLSHRNAPRLADTTDRELAILQSEDVAFRGQYVAAVIADTLETARHAASLVRVSYDEKPHDVELRADRQDLYAPEQVNAGYPTDTEEGDFDRTFSSAAVT